MLRIIILVAFSMCALAQDVHIDRLKELVNNKKSVVQDFIDIALYYEQQEELDSALNYLAIGVAQTKTKKDTSDIYRLYLTQASILYNVNPKEAIPIIKNVIDEHFLVDSILVQAYFQLGNCFSAIGYDNLAIECHLKSIAKVENIPQHKEQTLASNELSIAVIYSSMEKYDQAIKLYKKNLEKMEKDSNTLGISTLSNNLGSTLIRKNELDSAELYLLKAYKAIKDKEEKIELPCWSNLMRVYLKKGNYGKLEKMLNDPPSLIDKEHYKFYYYQYLNGEACLQIGKYNNMKLAESLLDSLIHLPTSILHISEQSIVFEQISELADRLNKPSVAYVYLKKHLDVITEQQKEKNRIRIEELAVDSKLKEAQQRNLILKKENDAFELKMMLIVIVFVIIVLGFLLVYRLMKQKSSLRDEVLLNHKRELSSITAYQLSKNENLLNLYNLLESKKQLYQDDPDIKEVLSLISKNIDLDKDWEQFTSCFDAVHNNFLTCLKEKASDITMKELKHCAYIRIGLSTKEIATLINITVRGVEKSRSKIRAKLQLSPEIDIYDYLMKL